MARITISVATDTDFAAIALDVNENQGRGVIAEIKSCEPLMMNYEVSGKIAAAIKHMVDPRVVKWSELEREFEPTSAVHVPPPEAPDHPSPPEPKTRLVPPEPELPMPKKTKLANG